MKYLTIIALLMNLGIATAYAQQLPVGMTFSGTAAGSTIDLKQPNSSTGEEDLAGKGTLGAFTFRVVKASTLAPQPSSACAGLYFPVVAGAGMLRFQDGSLLNVTLTGGGDCIDLVQMLAHCTWTLKITGGTGRFQNASGALTLTETATPALADAMNNPVFFTEIGDLTGTISGLAFEEESQSVRQ
jgi:hypothetical protein